MDEPFLINVGFQGVDREFEATWRAWGYTHRFHVQVDGMEVIFERDEEGSFRALIPPEAQGKVPPTELLQEIATAIERILA